MVKRRSRLAFVHFNNCGRLSLLPDRDDTALDHDPIGEAQKVAWQVRRPSALMFRFSRWGENLSALLSVVSTIDRSTKAQMRRPHT